MYGLARPVAINYLPMQIRILHKQKKRKTPSAVGTSIVDWPSITLKRLLDFSSHATDKFLFRGIITNSLHHPLLPHLESIVGRLQSSKFVFSPRPGVQAMRNDPITFSRRIRNHKSFETNSAKDKRTSRQASRHCHEVEGKA